MAFKCDGLDPGDYKRSLNGKIQMLKDNPKTASKVTCDAEELERLKMKLGGKIQSIYNTKDENLPSSSSEKLKELEEEIGGKITGLENSNTSSAAEEVLELEDLKKELEGIKTFIQDTNKISLTIYS